MNLSSLTAMLITRFLRLRLSYASDPLFCFQRLEPAQNIIRSLTHMGILVWD
jgi:hypothetical protein